MARRVDITAILNNPLLRRRLMIGVIQAIQLREGIETTLEQAAKAYDTITLKPED